MKEKNLKVSLLLDFYGETLTQKQREVIELYYDEDLSLAEIAEHAKITRQGVRDCIKRGEATLFFMEEKLGLAKRFERMEKILAEIGRSADQIGEINERYCFSSEIGDYAQKIKSALEELDAV